VLTWKKRCFLILQGSVLTQARWSETFWYAEMRYSFLVNLMQKLSQSVNICKSCCNKFTAVFLCPTVYIQLFLWTATILPYRQIYTKITTFRNFGGCKPTFLKPQRWNLARGCGPGLPPQAKFVKITWGGIPFLGKFISKNTDFLGLQAHILKPHQWNLA